mmetsp:Transcript_23401/g.40292  ORF Transcript_23401/g.40292 Transcript_23401/m.40292 type:complete len:136 (-) Transcript_23401:2049-2456(-)
MCGLWRPVWPSALPCTPTVDRLGVACAAQFPAQFPAKFPALHPSAGPQLPPAAVRGPCAHARADAGMRPVVGRWHSTFRAGGTSPVNHLHTLSCVVVELRFSCVIHMGTIMVHPRTPAAGMTGSGRPPRPPNTPA